MATITLRLEDTTRDELERLARTRGRTVSDLLRSAIDEFLGTDIEMPRSDVPRSMDMIQRRSLSLLHEILGLLSSDDEDYHRRQAQVLNEGFTAEYQTEFAAVGAELAPSECNLVWNILDMFAVLEASLIELSDDALAELEDEARFMLTFRGFDLNDPRESSLLRYARYLIETDRWTSLAGHFDDAQDGGNSHMPTLETYQRMVPAYKSILDRKVSGRGHVLDAYRFNISELREVLDTSRHPHSGH